MNGVSRSACALHQRVGPSGGMWILFLCVCVRVCSPRREDCGRGESNGAGKKIFVYPNFPPNEQQDGTVPLTTVVLVFWTAGTVYGVEQTPWKKPVRKTLKEPIADHRSDQRSFLEAPGRPRSCSRHRNFSQGGDVLAFRKVSKTTFAPPLGGSGGKTG